MQNFSLNMLTSRLRWVVGVLGLIAVTFGCKSQSSQCADGRCATLEPGAIPRPPGAYACQWQTAQVARASEDKFVIYENEWYLGGKELGPAGQQHIARLAAEMSSAGPPVVLQSHFDAKNNAPDYQLNDARRQAVVQQLLIRAVPDPDSRVIIGVPQAEGLYGPEAALIGAQVLQGGTRSGIGSGAGGTSTGGGSAVGGFGTTTGGGVGGGGGGMGIY